MRGFAKLAAVALVAGGVGIGLGIAIAALTDGDGGGPLVVSEAPTTTTRPSSPRAPLTQIRVSVGSAVLHPAATASGKRRRRARLGISLRVENRGPERAVLEPPSLLVASRRIPTNAEAARRSTGLRPIEPGRTAKVVLQFETAGAVTERLRTQRRARLHVAGRAIPITIMVGDPVSSRSRSGTAAGSG